MGVVDNGKLRVEICSSLEQCVCIESYIHMVISVSYRGGGGHHFWA